MPADLRDDICLGRVFINEGTAAWPKHPHIIASDPSEDPDHVVVVNVSTELCPGDVAYTLEPGDHRVITQRSYVRCDKALVSSVEKIKALYQRNAITLHQCVTAGVLKRVQRALGESRRPSRELQTPGSVPFWQSAS